MRLLAVLPSVGLVLVLLLVAGAKTDEPPAPSCADDYEVPVGAAHGVLWSTMGGKAEFLDGDGGPFVRFIFRANPSYLRFDRHASLRGKTDFQCRPGEAPAYLEADVRSSRVLRAGSELHLMLRGERNYVLPSASVATTSVWQTVRIPIPQDAPPFEALHFGAGAGWAREMPGQVIRIDIRNVRLRRRLLLQRQPPSLASATASWRDPDDPARPDPRDALFVARGVPEFAVADLPTGAEEIAIETPEGVSADLWRAEWLWTEQKAGVMALKAIRLVRGTEPLSVNPGEPDAEQAVAKPVRIWARLRYGGKPNDASETFTIRWKGGKLEKTLRILPIEIPESNVEYQLYYQMNEGWSGYSRYEGFYRNAAEHFAQMRALGFTGVHIAEEPRYEFEGNSLKADFERVGRYWQEWPLPLAEVVAAAKRAGLSQSLAWEGLRVFKRDQKWAGIGTRACVCDGPPQWETSKRWLELAKASTAEWGRRNGSMPYLSLGDEPGVHSADEVAEVKRGLIALKRAGFRTYLTTHARMYDSFHKLAPWLDLNVLHAEDVTAESYRVPERHGGKLWLYNGGGFNVAPPGQDRFFTGLYTWLSRAEGATQWVYTRPQYLKDPLDLRTRLYDDAQFYALPGRGDEPAATPGLLGMSMGIADRALLDHAQNRAGKDFLLAQYLKALRATLALPSQPDEYTPARLRKANDWHKTRAKLLSFLVK